MNYLSEILMTTNKKYRFPATIELEVENEVGVWYVASTYRVNCQDALNMKMMYIKSLYKTDRPYRIYIYYNSKVNDVIQSHKI